MSEATETVSRHGLGGNSPPISEALAEQYKDLVTRAQEWVDSVARHPTEIADDAILGKFGKTITELKGIEKAAKAAHTVEKAPYLAGGRAVDGFFNTLAGRAADAAWVLEGRQKVYLRKKADDARKAAEAEAALQAEEAAARLKEAERLQDTGDTDAAMTALTEAAVADTAATEATGRAEGKTADLVRVHSATGVTTSAKTFWNCTVEDRSKIDLSKIAGYINDDVILKAAKAAVKAGLRSCPGLKIFEDLQPLNRG